MNKGAAAVHWTTTGTANAARLGSAALLTIVFAMHARSTCGFRNEATAASNNCTYSVIIIVVIIVVVVIVIAPSLIAAGLCKTAFASIIGTE